MRSEHPESAEGPANDHAQAEKSATPEDAGNESRETGDKNNADDVTYDPDDGLNEFENKHEEEGRSEEDQGHNYSTESSLSRNNLPTETYEGVESGDSDSVASGYVESSAMEVQSLVEDNDVLPLTENHFIKSVPAAFSNFSKFFCKSSTRYDIIKRFCHNWRSCENEHCCHFHHVSHILLHR